MSDDPIDRLAKRVRGSQRAPKVARSNRTLALQEPNFTILQRYCQERGVTVSSVVDELIIAFLERVKDDLGPPPAPPDK
jgi:hypothetical protein